MFKKPQNYYKAIGVLVGYIIGVGMFGLPYLVTKAGVLNFFIFIIGLGLVKYFVHLIYANLIVATPGFHRMPGYAGIYLGAWGKHAVFAAKIIGNIGALLAYIIISGTFLHGLLSPVFGGSEIWYGSALFAIEALIVLFGIGLIARAELFMTVLLFVVVLMIAGKGMATIDMANYFALDWKYFLLPYGVMLFALDGSGALPIVSKLLNKDQKAIKSVVRVGLLASVAIMIIFVLAVVGMTGNATTPDSLVGIRSLLTNGITTFAMIFGILSMATSFILVAESVRETLWWDYNFNRHLAWALAVFSPFAFYLAGVRNLTSVVSLAGGVAGGFCALMLVLVFWKMKGLPGKLPLFKRQPADQVLALLSAMFIGGMVYELWHYFS